MNGGDWQAVFVGVASLAFSALSFVFATKWQTASTRSQALAAAKAVDAGAYDRAKDIYEAAIRELEGRNAGLRGEVERVAAENTRLRERVTVLEGRISDCERRLRR